MTIDHKADEGRVEGEARARAERAEAELNAAKASLERAQQNFDEATRHAEHSEVHDNEDDDSDVRGQDIRFFVDGEPVAADHRRWTPNEIIAAFTPLPPGTAYLVQITKHGEVSFRDKGDTKITVRNRDRYQTVSIGPTPVSDGTLRTGVAAFVEGLRGLGFSPRRSSTRADLVAIDYEVPCGRLVGRKIVLGFAVPGDFPLTPPGGPHVSPHVHPINSSGEHPSGRVHPSAEFEAWEGGPWQYWSRPFPRWAESKKTVGAYMQHIYRLWNSQ
jgi:hypothetical protein